MWVESDGLHESCRSLRFIAVTNFNNTSDCSIRVLFIQPTVTVVYFYHIWVIIYTGHQVFQVNAFDPVSTLDMYA